MLMRDCFYLLSKTKTRKWQADLSVVSFPWGFADLNCVNVFVGLELSVDVLNLLCLLGVTEQLNVIRLPEVNTKV